MSEQLFQLAFQFLKQEPRAAARLLETSDLDNLIPFLNNTPPAMVADLLQEMQSEYAAQFLTATDITTAQLWMQELRTRQLSAILRRVSPENQQALLNSLTIKKKTACQLLLSFRDDMVGAIAETDFVIFPTDMTVEDGVKRLKQRQYGENRLAFVIDNQRKLSGEVSLIRLLQTGKTQLIGEIQQAMVEGISGRSLIRTAISHPLWQKRDSAPVINRQRELVGVIWYSQLRQALSSSTNNSPAQSMSQHPTVDVLQAHGDSMRALVDVLFKAGT